MVAVRGVFCLSLQQQQQQQYWVREDFSDPCHDSVDCKNVLFYWPDRRQVAEMKGSVYACSAESSQIAWRKPHYPEGLPLALFLWDSETTFNLLFLFHFWIADLRSEPPLAQEPLNVSHHWGWLWFPEKMGDRRCSELALRLEPLTGFSGACSIIISL